jgi:magnesium transporter
VFGNGRKIGMIQLIEFDFAQRTDRILRTDEIPAARAGGRFIWADIAGGDPSALAGVSKDFQTPPEVTGAMARPAPGGRMDVYPSALHFSVVEPRWFGGALETISIECVLGPGYLLSVHASPSEAIDRMRSACREDFARHSKSSGFLLYELADQLRESYGRTLQELREVVETLQKQLFHEASDRLFHDAADRMNALNELRHALVGVRELFHALAQRKSEFVPESTQPHLSRLAETFGRLAGDLESERQLLKETLNLYIGMVGHRTNRIVSRLTVINGIFLPLMFLCGVYGMNFVHQPELQWKWGYAGFWMLVVVIAGGLYLRMRRSRWL